MKKYTALFFVIGAALLMAAAPIRAADGCGPGAHRTPQGQCHPGGKKKLECDKKGGTLRKLPNGDKVCL